MCLAQLTETFSHVCFGAGTCLNVEHWLRSYLLRCKNSIERTKETIDVLLSGRSNIPEFFQQRDPTATDVQGSFDAA